LKHASTGWAQGKKSIEESEGKKQGASARCSESTELVHYGQLLDEDGHRRDERDARTTAGLRETISGKKNTTEKSAKTHRGRHNLGKIL